MNITKKYFINLISAFLNNKQSAYRDDIDYNELYKLGNMHNVCGIIAKQLMGFNADEREKIENLPAFRQQLGYTLISYDKKQQLAKMLRDDFNINEWNFIFVKGTAIRDLYPVPELRTSGDIDLFFKKENYNSILEYYKNKNYELISNPNEIVFTVDGEHIELHNETDFDNPFFKNIFAMSIKQDKFEECLDIETNLLYVLTHIAKHFNHFGAGIRMFMDVDVLIRNTNNFDYDSFLTRCKSANIETFARAVFSLCRLWFDTPVKADFIFSDDMLEKFENVIIDGGSFGFEARTLGEYYIDKSLGKGEKNSLFSKFKAIMLLIFPSCNSLKNNYSYAKKYPLLLPAAWINRIFDGIFKRGKNSANTVKQIFSSGSEAEKYKKLMNELEI
ncbi:MAG: nucleotidyltransferase family protein [Eubacterium sp.]|nr:nucleotidyltransferase family protein [Eubacterium sp.]